MLITSTSLDALRVGFNASFQRGLGQAESQFDRIATTINSTTAENRYGWLGKMPNLREWFGERVINGLAEHDYSIRNRDFELTVGVDRNDIEDDNLGIYAPMFEEMGMSVSAHPNRLVFDLLKAGFSTECYDGQFFFDTDHPVLGANGENTTVSNTQGGSGAGWYLLSTRRAIKPIIRQLRKPYMFTAMDQPTDANVFHKKEFVYGTDGRENVGFAFWQMAEGSKQDLTAANYEAARVSMLERKGDYGRPLGIMPDLLAVSPANEGAAKEILENERNAAGATNKWRNTAELLVVPWLA